MTAKEKEGVGREGRDAKGAKDKKRGKQAAARSTIARRQSETARRQNRVIYQEGLNRTPIVMQ